MNNIPLSFDLYYEDMVPPDYYVPPEETQKKLAKRAVMLFKLSYPETAAKR